MDGLTNEYDFSNIFKIIEIHRKERALKPNYLGTTWGLTASARLKNETHNHGRDNYPKTFLGGIQSSAVIKRSSQTLYYVQSCSETSDFELA